MHTEWIDFERVTVPTRLGDLHLRRAGSGPRLILLHGFPQTGHAWRLVAPELTDRFRVLVPDLPGYGASAKPAPDAAGHPYDKRAMAEAILDLLDAEGGDRAIIVGHDRGGRVAYRMALDHPDRVAGLIAVDIVPTSEAWAGTNADGALKSFHWAYLAQPAALVEGMIGQAPDLFFGHLLDRWAGRADAITPDARERYLAPLRTPAGIAAIAGDYRAGAGIDRTRDLEDQAAGRRLACPVLTVSGSRYLTADPLPVWRRWATGPVEGVRLDCGHFLADEEPAALTEAIAGFAEKASALRR